MDIEEILQKSKEVLRLGEAFAEAIMSMHAVSTEEAKQLEELTKRDDRFKELDVQLRELQSRLGM